MYLATKRVFDLTVSICGLILSSPILFVAVVAIRATSRGAAIFAQERVGRHENPFTCYKLRTMKAGTRQAGTHEVSSSSVTRVGKFLRAAKLDELPQLWNVMTGEMSLVGPRPCLPVQSELIEERRARGVFEVLPGITGLSQVEGIDMSSPRRLAERDGDYLQSHSFWGDVALIFRTLIGHGGGDRIATEKSASD